MRIFLLIIIVLHGLIHLLGFVKAFDLASVKELTIPISKPYGIIWIIAFVLFALTAILLAFGNDYWILSGVISVLISQVLIIVFWQDAKIGTLANFIILIGLILGYGTWNFYSTYQKEVSENIQKATFDSNDLLTEQDISDLPQLVKDYIRYTGSIGKPKVFNFKIEFTGKIRKDEKSEWMPFDTEQYNFINEPTRLFFMKAVMKHLPVAGFHCFRNGDAFMDIRLLSLYKVQFQDGAVMDTSETVTFFNDMCCMAPATLIDKRIVWEESDSNSVKATFSNNGISISARLYFNDKGELINFVSHDRYAAGDNNQMTKLPWSTPMSDYKEIDGYKLAGYAEAIYSYPWGDVCYGIFSIRKIKYNCIDYEWEN